MTEFQTVPQVVAAKLFKAQGLLNFVMKEGQVSGFASYKYAKAEDFIMAVKTAAQEVGLIVVVSHENGTIEEFTVTNAKGSRTEFRARIQTFVTLIDSETGEQWQTPGVYFGEGADSGDKAFYKAMTGGTKYALAGLFLTATTDDPEKFDGQESPDKVTKKAVTTRQRTELADHPVNEPKVYNFNSWAEFWTEARKRSNFPSIQAKVAAANPDSNKQPNEVAREIDL